MFLFKCAQRGCGYNEYVEKLPAECPNCGLAVSFPDAGDEGVAWDDWTKSQLLDAVAEHNSSVEDADCIEGITSSTRKADIIAALKEAGVEPEAKLET